MSDGSSLDALGTASWPVPADASNATPGPLGLVRSGLSEAGAMVRGAVELGWSIDGAYPGTRADGPPVVLVHGYLGHVRMLRPLAKALAAAGATSVHPVGYPSTRLPFEHVIDRVAAVAEPLARAHGQVDLVGHSLGALACQAWLKLYGGHVHVRRFVSLAGPHGGTALFRVVPSPVRVAFDPDGPWIRRLVEGPEPVPTRVIRARHDQQVLPPSRARIDGAHEVVLDGLGHNALLFAPRAHREVIAALALGGQRDGAS